MFDNSMELLEFWDCGYIPKKIFYLLDTLIDGETMEIVTDFILGGTKITADDCSHEINRCLLLGRKAMANLDSILKIWDITLLTKVRLVKAMVFPVVMCGCESWSIKKAECHRTDAFELSREYSWESLELQGDQTSQL